MSETDANVTNCANCHLPMPRGLRFCRNCGYRLGEGSAEYTETVRFQNAPPGTLPNNNAPIAPYSPPSVPYGGKKKSRISGTTWMFIGLLIFFITAASLTAIVKRRLPPRIPSGGVGFIAQRSFAGVDNWATADENIGVTFESVDTPGGPADKAGLVGGDIITVADGQPVHSDDEMTEIMRRTPIGKTIDIVYLRDGETKNTKLTPVSREEARALERAYERRAEGHALFGYDPGQVERVEIPNTKMSGVKLNKILPSRPADMVGIKNGDIIVEFGGTPIRTVGELAMRVKRTLPYTTVPVVLIRDGQRMEIPVKVGRDE